MAFIENLEAYILAMGRSWGIELKPFNKSI